MSSRNRAPSKNMAEVIDPTGAQTLGPTYRSNSLPSWTPNMSAYTMTPGDQSNSFMMSDHSMAYGSQSGSEMHAGQFYQHPQQTHVDESARRRASGISNPDHQYLQGGDHYSYDKSSQSSFAPQHTGSLFQHGSLESSPGMHRNLNPAPSSSYMGMATDVAGVQRLQRNPSSSTDFTDIRSQRKKRPFPPIAPEPAQTPVLRDDEKFLLTLKDEQGLPWKEIAAKFQLELGQIHQIPALQMRYKRLKERIRVWTEADTSALKQAHEYWEQKKWDIISEKLADFGAVERFSARSCARKWEEMNPGSESTIAVQQSSSLMNMPTSHSPTLMAASTTQSYPQPSYSAPNYWS